MEIAVTSVSHNGGDTSPDDRGGTAWHSLSDQSTFVELGASESGLSSEQAAVRLDKYGPNRLQPPQPKSAALRFAEQFNNVLIYVLLLAALVTALLGHWLDTAVIVGVVFINAVIGFLQEGKAERALDAIRNMLSMQALVLRDGSRTRRGLRARSPSQNLQQPELPRPPPSPARPRRPHAGWRATARAPG